MLVPFPIAFLVGGLAADTVGLITGHPDAPVLGYWLILAGLVMGTIAAIPGLVDYVATVPPDSSAKRRATKHLVVNATALLLFAIAWYLRGGPGVQPEPILVVLEATGAVLLGIGGWMGGVLAFRNQIGVDHRYAGAGKWSEAAFPAGATGPVPVASTDELEVDQMKLLKFGAERIVLARTEDGWVAFSDHCTHRGGSLAGGVMACGTVVCPWHGSQFDVRTGEVRAGPAESPIRTFPVDVDGTSVRVDPRG